MQAKANRNSRRTHLDHFQLTERLWPALKQAGVRVISLSSAGIRFGGVDFDDL